MNLMITHLLGLEVSASNGTEMMKGELAVYMAPSNTVLRQEGSNLLVMGCYLNEIAAKRQWSGNQPLSIRHDDASGFLLAAPCLRARADFLMSQCLGVNLQQK